MCGFIHLQPSCAQAGNRSGRTAWQVAGGPAVERGSLHPAPHSPPVPALSALQDWGPELPEVQVFLQGKQAIKFLKWELS